MGVAGRPKCQVSRVPFHFYLFAPFCAFSGTATQVSNGEESSVCSDSAPTDENSETEFGRESYFSRGGGSANRRVLVASSRPSLKCPLAAFPAASEDFSEEFRQMSTRATSQGISFFEISPESERNFSGYVCFQCFLCDCCFVIL